MNSEEKAKKILEITEEIEEIQFFMNALTDEIMHVNKINRSFIQKKTTFSFFGIWNRSRVIDIQIPEKMKIEINAKCFIWVEELKRRIEKMIPTDK